MKKFLYFPLAAANAAYFAKPKQFLHCLRKKIVNNKMDKNLIIKYKNLIIKHKHL